ncbi:MAG: carboxypeptidase-like regulatory domain-containing protein, partial [Candidatus Dojkabacteria bacterium]|nr:carboxypeptidase-like regulatory domain-containing protein [Candidatus Dojkabacteria bacterium]
VPSDINVALTQNESIVPTEASKALYGEQEVRVKSGEYIVADVPVLFSKDRDWSSVVVDVDTESNKAVVKFAGDSGVEKPFTLYIIQGTTNSLVVCPSATAVEDITIDCTGGVKFTGDFPQTKEVEGNDVSVSQVILNKVKYWVADGLVGTGAQGYVSDGSEEEEEEKVTPTITFQPVIDGINSVIEAVKGTTLSILDSTPVKDLNESELQNISVATTVVTIAVSTSVMLGSLPQAVYLLIQAILGILSAFGFRRKRVYYGYVYDSYSKEPIDAAIIRIYNMEKSLIETAITDSTGKFFGNLPQGEYTLEIRKRGYIFPSSFIKGKDYPIQNVYGGSINISDDKSDLEVAIPMDREELSGSRKLFISFKKILSILLSILNILIFVAGIFIFIYMYSKFPNTGNLLIGLIYIPAIYFIGRSIFGKYMNYGKVVDGKGKGLKGISLVLKDKEFNRIVNKRVTDHKGRYRFVVNKGVYILDIDEANYKVEKVDKGNEIDIKKNNGIVAKKIVVKKA